MNPSLRTLTAATALLVSVMLSGCVSLSSEGVQFDRRTLGAQTDDTQIEWRVSSRMPDAIRGAKGVSVTSYNHPALLTGQLTDALATTDAVRDSRRVFALVLV